MTNAILIDDRDNTAVAIEPVRAGQRVIYATKDGGEHALPALQDIPVYHKIAVRGIAKGEPVLKYGERIGVASSDIAAGAHVHEHNVGVSRNRGEG